MNPLQPMLELLRMRQEMEAPPRLVPPDFRSLGYNDQQPGIVGSTPFRDPMQAGPSPPPREILSAMTRGKR